MTRYPVVLFDVGRTLLDHDTVAFGRDYVGVMARYGLTYQPEEILAAARAVWFAVDEGPGLDHREHSVSAEAYASWNRGLSRRVLVSLGVPEPSEAMLDELMTLIERFDYRSTLFDDTLEALDALKNGGVRLAAVSNAGWNLLEHLQSVGLAFYFEVMLTSAHVGYRKPHPEMFRHALDAMQIEASDALFIGDSLRADIFGAQNAGIDALLLDRTAAHPAHSPSIRSLSELPEWLRIG